MIHIPFLSSGILWLKRKLFELAVGPAKKKYHLDSLEGDSQASWRIISNIYQKRHGGEIGSIFLSYIQTLEGITITDPERDIEISFSPELQLELQTARSRCTEIKALLGGAKTRISAGSDDMKYPT
jgi:hypothetical protein